MIGPTPVRRASPRHERKGLHTAENDRADTQRVLATVFGDSAPSSAPTARTHQTLTVRRLAEELRTDPGDGR